MHDEPVRVLNYLDAADTNSHARRAAQPRRDRRDARRRRAARARRRPARRRRRSTSRSTSATRARSCACCRAGSRRRRAGPGRSTATSRSAAARSTGSPSRWRQMGARLEARDGRFPPFTVHGARLRGIEYVQPQASAQVKSCLLLAGLLADGRTTVGRARPQPRPHRAHARCARACRCARSDGAVTVSNVDELGARRDRGPRRPLLGRLPDRRRADRARLAARARARSGSTARAPASSTSRAAWAAVILGDLEERPADARSRRRAGRPSSTSSAGPLVGTTVEPDEVPLAIDELPLVALLGCFAEGETVVRGASELRIKESDRTRRPWSTGCAASAPRSRRTEDGFVVQGTGGLEGGVLDSHGDHRLAMLGAVAGLASRDGVRVVGIDVAAVSYPQFREHLRHARLGRPRGRNRRSRLRRCAAALAGAPTARSSARRCTRACSSAPRRTPRPVGRRSRCSRRGPTRPRATCRPSECWARCTARARRATRRELARFYPSAGGDPRRRRPVAGAARGARGAQRAHRRAHAPAGADQRGRPLRRAARAASCSSRARPACRCGCSRSGPARGSTCAGTATATSRTAPAGAIRAPRCASAIRSRAAGGRRSTSPWRCASAAAATPSPVDPAGDEGRLTLESYVWPDMTARLEQLRGALDDRAARPGDRRACRPRRVAASRRR